MNNRWMAPVSALTVLLSLQACTRAPATDQDRASVQQLLDKYFESVKAADTKLASTFTTRLRRRVPEVLTRRSDERGVER
jgi:hypothetical protein